jgi:hypothetical protein
MGKPTPSSSKGLLFGVQLTSMEGKTVQFLGCKLTDANKQPLSLF